MQIASKYSLKTDFLFPILDKINPLCFEIYNIHLLPRKNYLKDKLITSAFHFCQTKKKQQKELHFFTAPQYHESLSACIATYCIKNLLIEQGGHLTPRKICIFIREFENKQILFSLTNFFLCDLISLCIRKISIFITTVAGFLGLIINFFNTVCHEFAVCISK